MITPFYLKNALYLLLPLAMLCNSCNKRGCLDTDAENYKPGASKDCGCCIFYGKGLVWYSYDQYKHFESIGVTQFFYSVNGQSVGKSTKSLNSYYRTAPLGEASFDKYNGIKDSDGNVIVVNLGTQKTKKVYVIVTDQAGRLLRSDSILFKANRFIEIQI